MEKSKKRARAILWFALFALAEFLIYYVLYLSVTAYDAVYYYLYFAERFILLLIPVATGAIMAKKAAGTKSSLLFALYVSLTRLIPFIPFFYLEYVYGPYDSVEAILLSLLTSAVTAAVNFALTVGVFYFISHLAKGRGGADTAKIPLFNTGNPYTLGIMICSLVIFALNLGMEIYTSVLFFAENGSVFFINELVMLVVSYVYLAVLLLGLHLVSCVAVNCLSKK
ncbi:MAG: hypothetical protein IJ515_04660 [Clostridia bacterium]|nr:hypothetical protein [Clostridia bacterium]